MLNNDYVGHFLSRVVCRYHVLEVAFLDVFNLAPLFALNLHHLWVHWRGGLARMLCTGSVADGILHLLQPRFLHSLLCPKLVHFLLELLLVCIVCLTHLALIIGARAPFLPALRRIIALRRILTVHTFSLVCRVLSMDIKFMLGLVEMLFCR